MAPVYIYIFKCGTDSLTGKGCRVLQPGRKDNEGKLIKNDILFGTKKNMERK